MAKEGEGGGGAGGCGGRPGECGERERGVGEEATIGQYSGGEKVLLIDSAAVGLCYDGVSYVLLV